MEAFIWLGGAIFVFAFIFYYVGFNEKTNPDAIAGLAVLAALWPLLLCTLPFIGIAMLGGYLGRRFRQ